MNFLHIILSIILFLFTIFIVLTRIKRKKCIDKIKKSSTEEKCHMLNKLVHPLGYFYDHCKDTFHTTIDAWQRDFGYGQIYDKAAPHFNMIFDSMPIYFDYNGITWLIEFWKGQYGINIGGEVGIYKADRLLKESEYETEIFKTISDNELFPICMNLYHKDVCLGCICRHHWWLTTFVMGKIALPNDVFLEVNLTFPDCEMLDAFIDALAKHPLAPEDIRGNGLNISFVFDNYVRRKNLYANWVMLKNRFFCKLFLWASAPFESSIDRILYLYEYAPFTLRKLINIHSKKQYRK